MTTLREVAQQALEAMLNFPDDISDEMFESITALKAALAEPEQRPISDVTEAVTKTVIEVEKLLCEKIGRQWQPSDMSIRTLVDELATLVAEREREACAIAGGAAAMAGLDHLQVAAAIWARGQT